jgi:small subunit ribosomal protein S1
MAEENSSTTMADLLKEYDRKETKRLHVGDKVRVEIISISKDTLFVDTGMKIDGTVEIAELLDENGSLPYRIGDTLELYVMSIRSRGIVLSRALSGVGGLNMLEQAYEKNIPVEGKVKSVLKGGLEVEVMKRRTFCPASQVDIKYAGNLEDFVGNTFNFLITEFEEEGRNIILSRRILLEQEQEKNKASFRQELAEGNVVTGRVVRVMPFGAFVELTPGIEGLIPISELGWARVDKVEDLLHEGDTVTAKIITLSPEKVTLSLKQVSADPWDSVSERYSAGQKLRGKVTRLAKFGAFVELEPGIDGLVHISEMSYLKRINNPSEVAKPGDAVDVMIKEVDGENHKISLSIKDAEGDPWIDIENKYPLGKPVTGIVEKKERFGWFIQLEPGITGLMPKSRVDKVPDPAVIEKLSAGDKIIVKTEEINATERRITLAPAGEADDDWRQYTTEAKVMSPLAAKLQAAIDKKKKN